MAGEPHIFGIRHHGPGSARQLVRALDDLCPQVVLVEGPADASDLLPLLADPAMVPPVALLTYPVDAPAEAAYWPFARYSPEYQAVCWAVQKGVPVRFIDLPASWRSVQAPDTGDGYAKETTEDGQSTQEQSDLPAEQPVHRDPIGALSRAAGYEDGESWWHDVIEENPAPGPVFAAVADAMAALREDAPAPEPREAAREAHMRLEIAKAVKETEGVVAVVCGAWHVPALRTRTPAKADRALLKGAVKRKIAATWAPWTSPRLALASGYGAGVAAPGWCAHLWEAEPSRIPEGWLGKVAATLRKKGHMVSTASLIEAHRLAAALSALRGRPAPGFEELRDAAIACLCSGEALLWETVAEELLIGAQVGAIPENVPLAPLLEDLQRQQKATRLKPEALDRELSLDLRSESGLARSTLLHRLQILGVPWGRLADMGRSRGTFRERWNLRWEPEYSVALVEQLVYGPTIEKAATGRMDAELAQAHVLGRLAELTLDAMTAQLGKAAATGIDLLGRRAGETADCPEMLAALPPLAEILRYGKARATDTEQLADLLRRIALQGALSLSYAARDLDAEAAAELAQAIVKANRAIRLAELPGEETVRWSEALQALIADSKAARLVSGTAARLLYEADELPPADAVMLLGRMLSPGTAVGDAAAFFEGFMEGAGRHLIYDKGLRDAIDRWLGSLDSEEFVHYLPLFRRVFSVLDAMERRRLLDVLFGRAETAMPGKVLYEGADADWARHLPRLAEILSAESAHE